MKIIKYFFAFDFFACGFIGIFEYHKTSEIVNLLASTFCFIIAILLFRSASKKKLNKTIINQTDCNLEQKREGSLLNDSLYQTNKAPSAEDNVEETIQQNINNLPSLDFKQENSYINDGNIIIRTDGKEITDEEVPYLIQLGREKAIANWKIPDLTRIITESYQIMRTTDNPETLCSRYKIIIAKINELAVFEQQGSFDTNTFSQYKALISDDNFYALIVTCYQKYVFKAQSELKTQNGINNRINKFWKTIYNNVSIEFYNSKLRNNNG